MNSLLLLGACLLLGVAVGRFGKPAPTLAQNLNWWVLNIALPALVLHLIPTLRLDWHLWFLPASMLLVFAGAWALFSALGRRLQWSRQQIGGLTLVCGLGNTSFVGFPMIEALRGQEGLALAVVTDQLGSFLTLAIGGSIVAAMYSGGRAEPRQIARKILFFPPFLSLILGAAIAAVGSWPAALEEIFSRIGATLVPLALFSVGLQLRLRLAPGQMKLAAIGLCWKLFIAAGMVYMLGRMLHVSEPVLAIAVLESAMAPMISAAILATQYDLDPPLTNTLLGIGILCAFVTVPIINMLIL